MRKTKRILLLLCPILLLNFLLGVRNGKVALWKYDDPTPIKIFPYSVSALPDKLQRALEQGIRIESEADLTELLEKYLP